MLGCFVLAVAAAAVALWGFVPSLFLFGIVLQRLRDRYGARPHLNQVEPDGWLFVSAGVAQNVARISI